MSTAMSDDLLELMRRKEPLHPELAEWIVQDGPFGPMLKHPLVFEMLFDPERCGRINAQYKAKQEALREARAKENWHSYVWLHERPYRLYAFGQICWQLAGEDYWELVGQIWTDTENQWQNRDEWREVLEADEEGREYMSTEDVREVFTLPPDKGGLLPETVIYRGFRHEDGLDGYSWTLDKARARWFAKRFDHHGGEPMIARATVKREHVIAYITSRDEQEIVVLPEHVENITWEEA